MSKLAPPTTAAAPPAAPPAPAYGAAAMVDLEDKVNWANCEALNKTSQSSLQNVLKQGLRDQETLLLESDADEQLLLRVAFKSRVKLHSICVSGPGDGRAPKALALFVNRPNLDFGDTESMQATQELELSSDQLGQRLDLKFVSFQAVDHLTVFVRTNQGDAESSALSNLQIWGAQVHTTNMGDFKRVAGEAGESD